MHFKKISIEFEMTAICSIWKFQLNLSQNSSEKFKKLLKRKKLDCFKAISKLESREKHQ